MQAREGLLQRRGVGLGLRPPGWDRYLRRQAASGPGMRAHSLTAVAGTQVHAVTGTPVDGRPTPTKWELGLGGPRFQLVRQQGPPEALKTGLGGWVESDSCTGEPKGRNPVRRSTSEAASCRGSLGKQPLWHAGAAGAVIRGWRSRLVSPPCPSPCRCQIYSLQPRDHLVVWFP